MNRTLLPLLIVAAAGLLLTQGPAWAISLGQLDDFNDGTTQGWDGATETNVPDSGPLGLGDHALTLSAFGGGGPNSRLIVENETTWAGDYSVAGITGISLDVNNPNPMPLTIRLAINGNGGGFSSTDGVDVPAASGWHSIFLPLSPSPGVLSPVSRPPLVDLGTDVGLTLATVSELRILHNTSPSWIGATLDADLVIDNVQAIPEPSGILLLGVAAAVLLFRSATQARRSTTE